MFDARFTSKTVLEWPAVIGADRYDVSRGTISALDGSDYGACLAEDIPTSSLTDTDAVPADDGFFYVIRGEDLTSGPGSLGNKSGPSERTNSNGGACSP